MEHISIRCPFCKNVVRTPVSEEVYDRYADWSSRIRSEREPVQKVFPELSAEIREMLISGICPKCWDEMFGEEDDE